MSMRLNEEKLIAEVFRSIPPVDIQLVVTEMPVPYLQRFIRFLAKHFESSAHLEYHLLWCLHLFNNHGRYLKNNSASFLPSLRTLQKNLTNHYQSLSKVYESAKKFSSFFHHAKNTHLFILSLQLR